MRLEDKKFFLELIFRDWYWTDFEVRSFHQSGVEMIEEANGRRVVLGAVWREI